MRVIDASGFIVTPMPSKHSRVGSIQSAKPLKQFPRRMFKKKITETFYSKHDSSERVMEINGF
jgi:hypothetical protein